MKLKNKQPLVSINIPTFNSAKTLEKTLLSIKDQTYPKIEIILADGYSKDKTVKIARKYGARITYALEVGKARRKTVEASRGKYLFFLDSDQTIKPRFIARCVEMCEKGNYDALTLSEISIITNNSFIEKVVAYDKWLFHSCRDDDAVRGDAIPRFFRSEVFNGIDWPEDLFMFEHNAIYLELIKKGIKVKFVPNLYFYHYEQNTLPKIFKRFFHYGQSYLIAAKKYPTALANHSLPRRTYFTKKAFEKPGLWVGLFLLYFVKVVAGSLGVLVYLLRGGKDERSAKMLKTKK